MAAWRKKEVDGAKNRQERRETGKLLSYTEAYNLRRYTNFT